MNVQERCNARLATEQSGDREVVRVTRDVRSHTMRKDIDYICGIADAPIWLSEGNLPAKVVAVRKGGPQIFNRAAYDFGHEHHAGLGASGIPGFRPEWASDPRGPDSRTSHVPAVRQC